VAKKCTLCPEYKALCLGHIQHNTSLSPTLHILKHGDGFIMLWVCLSSARTREFCFGFFLKQNRVKHRQNPEGKPGSVCFPTDLGDKFTGEGQMYTDVAFQDDIECS
jgi:hypothetical protein